MVKVAVVGAGIIGLSSAIAIQSKIPGIDITLISEKFSPDTTGDGAAGVWEPYLVGKTDPALIAKWSRDTFALLLKLWNTPNAGELGISLLPVYYFTSDPNMVAPNWKNTVLGFRDMTPEEIGRMNKPGIKKGFAFTTFICEPLKLLPHLLRQFEKAGGNVVKKKITKLGCLRKEFDIVVHCTGVEAFNVVQDNDVHPIRGQVMRVEAPGTFHVYLDLDDDGRYIIPNQENVVMGGTHQRGDWNLTVSDSDAQFIKAGCNQFIPSIKDAKVLRHWVGLRPGRTSIRLEMETLTFPGEYQPLRIIHNYGHGGAGVTLFWGCALHAAALVQNAVHELDNYKTTCPSRLSKL